MTHAHDSVEHGAPVAGVEKRKKLPPLPLNADGSLRLIIRPMPWPKAVRRPGQTDAQFAVDLRVGEEHDRNMSIWEGLMRLAIVRHGLQKNCRRKICRRSGACLGTRPPEALPMHQMLPPCQNADIETFMHWRDEAKAILYEAFPHLAAQAGPLPAPAGPGAPAEEPQPPGASGRDRRGAVARDRRGGGAAGWRRC